jgi:hypothetical protein
MEHQPDAYLQITPDLSLSPRDRSRHTLITGAPGTGMGTFMLGLINQDIYAHRPVLVLDSYGELSSSIIQEADEETRQRIVYLDYGSLEYPLGINIFDNVPEQYRHEVVRVLIDLLYQLYDPDRSGIIGPRFEESIKNGIHTILHDEEPTVAELVRCYTDQEYVRQISPKIGDLMLSKYWKDMMEKLPQNAGEIEAFIMSKLGLFVSDRRIRLALCQKQSALRLEQWVTEDKIILCDFGGVRDSDLHRDILTWFFMYDLYTKIRNRSSSDSHLSLYVDDVSFWPGEFSTRLIQEGRRYNTDLVTSIQQPALLSDYMLDVLFRIENLVSFRSSSPDADLIAPLFHSDHISANALACMHRFYAYLKLMQDGNPHIPAEPVRFTYEPAENQLSDEDTNRMKDEQRKLHARPAQEVDEEIQGRVRS